MTADSQNDKSLTNKFDLSDSTATGAELNLLNLSPSSFRDLTSPAPSGLSPREQELFGNLMLCAGDIRPLYEELLDQKFPTREELENERVEKYLTELRTAPDAVSATNSIYLRMPDKVAVKADGSKIALSSESVQKLLEAIPGLKLPDTFALREMRGVSLDGNTLLLDGKAKFSVGEGKDQIRLSLDNMKGEFKVDPKDPTRVTLENITGLTATKLGADVAVKSITVQLKEDKDGNLTLRVEPGEVKGAEVKGKDLFSGLQSGYNRIGAALGQSKIQPFEIPLCNRKDAPIAEVMQQLGNWIQKPEARDAGKVAESIASLYIDKEFSSLFKGVKGVEKDGNNFVLKSDGGSLHHIGGLPVAWDKDIKIKVEPGKAPKLNIESGMKIQLPVPPDVAGACGLPSPLEFAIKELSVSEIDKNGHRIATMKMDGPVESVSIRLDAKMQPVPIDKSGKVQISAKLKDTNIGLDLQFHPQQVAEGKLDKIDFRLNVADKHDQLPAAIEKFFGHELDPNLRKILTGVRSLERSGDKVTIGRAEHSVHEMGGLKVYAGKEVSFKLSSDKTGTHIKDASGVAIVALPGFANTIYATRLPIYLKDITLGTPDKDGNRRMTIRSEGAMRDATVDMDASMKPTKMWVTVENPVDAFKESLKGGRGLDLFAARLKNTTKYTIHIDGAGNVDYGGLAGAADMFSKAGDFLSIEGAAAAAIGYAGQKFTGQGAKADADLFDTIKRSWNSIFGD